MKNKVIEDIKNNKYFIDIHSHIFNYQHVPDGFVGLRLPFTKRFLTFLEHITHFFGVFIDSSYGASRFLDRFNDKNQATVLRRMENDNSKNGQMAFVILTMDMTNSVKGTMKSTFESQIREVAMITDLYNNHNTTKVLPFLCLNPRNPAMKSLFFKWMVKENNTFYGVKIYPPLGYFPSHPNLMEIYEYCQENRIPVLAHCGRSPLHASDKVMECVPRVTVNKYGHDTIVYNDYKFPNSDSYGEVFAHPLNWCDVLRKYPRLKLDLAHIGGAEEIEKYGTSFSWVDDVLDLCNSYENVYTDFSFAISKKEVYDRIIKLYKSNVFHNKLLYGSDNYMITLNCNPEKLYAKIRKDLPELNTDNAKRYLF